MRIYAALGLAAIFFFAASCGGGVAAPAVAPTAAISVTVSASPPAVAPGQTAQLTATVPNDSANAGVQWVLAPGAPGALSTVDSLHATYTAPASISQSTTVLITATSVADPSQSAQVSVGIAAPISVSVTANPANLGLNQTSQLTAAADADPKSAGVIWTLAAGAPGTLTIVGPLQASYTSPATLAQIITVQITATSVTDPARSAQITISVNPAVQISAVAQSTNALGPLQATLITASGINDNRLGVTWSLAAGAPGTITTVDAYDAAYTAPTTIALAGSYNVTATSLADATKSATVSVSLVPPVTGPTAVWENLVQYENGLAYEGGTNPPYAAMETAPGSKVFQSGLLIFHDTAYGTEVWRVDTDPDSETANDGPLNRPPWDANGSHFQVWSSRVVPETNGQLIWVYNADASTTSLVWPVDPTRAQAYQDALLQDGAADANLYLPWDINRPGVLYSATWDDTQQASGPNPNATLYAIDMTNAIVSSLASATGFLATKVTDLPNPTLRKDIQTYPAPDGMLMVKDINPGADANGNPLYIPDIYMVPTNGINFAPQNSSYPGVQYSYSISFNLNQFASLGHATTNEYHLHDIYFRRSANDDYIFNYGPLGSVGETIFFEAPVNGNAANLSVVYANVNGACPVPGGTPYYSHPAWSSDGSLVAYFGESTCGSNDYGVHIRNQAAGSVVSTLAGATDGHLGWDGFDPNFIAFDGQIGGTLPDGNIQRGLYSADPISNGSSRVLVGYEEQDPNNSPTMVEGPDQSPDGTKILFTVAEHFVTSPAKSAYRHTYIAVDHRPIPPVLAATSGGTSVTLTWTPYLAHREVAGYHVYRSPQGAKSFHEISSGLVNGTAFTDGNLAAGQIFDYAVTAQEFSGLESNQLSNIEEVTIGGGATQFQAAGMTGWDTTAPAPPTNVSATIDPTSKAFITLRWTASAAPDLRYYKIYYGDGSAPQAQQAYLIATPPAENNSWIVWTLDPNVPPVFGISAVDRQDNESSMTCLQTANPGLPCQ